MTAWMWDNQGYAYYKLKMYNEAINDYTSAIKVNPYYARAFRRRGNTHKKMQKYNLALQDYSAGLEASPDNVNLLLRRAKFSYKIFSDTAATLNDLERVLIIYPKNKKARL